MRRVINMEKKINKKKIVIQGLKYTTMLGIGYLIGFKAGGQKFSDSLNMLARTGMTVYKVIDDKKYILSIVPE